MKSRRARFALMAGHCAGVVDLVALPIWVGTLVAAYGFDLQQAGGLCTLFLLGVVAASAFVAPRLLCVSGRRLAAIGYGIAAAGFCVASAIHDFAALAALHVICGLANGAALSVTHGAIARSARPHRLFAIVGIALGFFGITFFAVMPGLLAAWGGPVFFLALGAIMGTAALAAALMFPDLPTVPKSARTPTGHAPMPHAVWFGIGGIVCMSLVQAATFGFLERAGASHGFAREAIADVLVAAGFVALLPPTLAGMLEGRLQARSVLLAGPFAQAVLSSAVMTATTFSVYAIAAAVFASVMIFTHTFAFGLLAQLEPTGRALAATPAMIMTGSAIGPLLGGTLIKAFGFASVGWLALLLAVLAVILFSRLPADARAVSGTGRYA